MARRSFLVRVFKGSIPFIPKLCISFFLISYRVKNFVKKISIKKYLTKFLTLYDKIKVKNFY